MKVALVRQLYCRTFSGPTGRGSTTAAPAEVFNGLLTEPLQRKDELDQVVEFLLAEARDVAALGCFLA
ncbi:MAG: hypothetical protein ABIP48_21950, partial [Planctomycetota bacterium]